MSGPGLLQNSDKHPVACDISKRRYIYPLLYTQRYTQIGNFYLFTYRPDENNVVSSVPFLI